MSYSFSDVFYIDTDTSIATIKGNLDLQNNVRFAKTTTEDGVVIQANIIKDYLKKNSELFAINNFTNSNTVTLDIQDIYPMPNNQYKILLDIENLTSSTSNLPIANKTIQVYGNHKLCLKIDYPNLTSESTYLPYLGTKIYNLDYATSNDHDYFVGYTNGTNTLTESSTGAQLAITKPTGYFLHNASNHVFKASWHLLCDESYFSGVALHSNQQIITGIYKNQAVSAGTPFTTIGGSNVTPITLPQSFNDAYIFILANDITYESTTFIKYFKTQGNTVQSTFPKLIPMETSSFLCAFLAKTDPLLPIVPYTYDTATAAYRQDTLNGNPVSIPGTSFANNYQYVLVKLTTAAAYLWAIRIVVKNINLTIPNAIDVIYHENDTFTVSILNNVLTDLVVYNTNLSTTFIVNCYNVLIHFSAAGVYQWATKVDTLSSFKNVLNNYSSNTFFVHAVYDPTIQGATLASIYNSDGTTFNTLNTTTADTVAATIYYGEDGKVRHYNHYTCSLPTIRPFFATSASATSNTQMMYAQLNTATLSNVAIEYTDAFLNQINYSVPANSISFVEYNYLSQTVGQKQLNFGEDLKKLRMNAETLTLTGAATIDNDLTVRKIQTSSNITMANGSRLGIGTLLPRYTLDVLGTGYLSGNVGIGTTLITSKLTVQSVNQDPMSIQNLTSISYPVDPFITSSTPNYGPDYNFTCNIIDPLVDIQEIPPPSGSYYGEWQDFVGSYTYTATSSNTTDTTYAPSKAFDKDYFTAWRSRTVRYNRTTGVPYNSNLTTVSGTGYYGEWLQMDLIQEYFTKPRLRMGLYNYNVHKDITNVGTPVSWIIAGSNDVNADPTYWNQLGISKPSDDIGWTLLDKRDNYTLNTSSSNFTIANTTSNYGHFRMIVTKTTPGYDYCSLGELRYNMNIVFRNSYPAYTSYNYTAATNSRYHYFYNDRVNYNPLMLMNGPADSSHTLGITWRSGKTFTNVASDSIIPCKIELYYPAPINFNSYGFIGTQLSTMPTNWLFEYYGETGASTSNWIQLDKQVANIPTQLTTSYTLPTLYNGASFRFSLSNNNSPTDAYLELKRIQIKNQLAVTALSIDQSSKALFASGVGIGTTTSTLVNQLGVNAETYFYKDVTFKDRALVDGNLSQDLAAIRGVVELAFEGENNTSRGRKGHRGIEWYFGNDNRWGLVQDGLYNLALYTSSAYLLGNGDGSSITFNKANTVNDDSTIAFTEFGRFNYQGNLGIGTTRPSQKLHVVGNAYINGSVGIGTTKPLSTLHVVGTARATTFLGSLDWVYIVNRPPDNSIYPSALYTTGVNQTFAIGTDLQANLFPYLRIQAWGSGGGGGSGSHEQAVTTILTGGSGGGSASYINMVLKLDQIGKIEMDVYDGGTGGASVYTASTYIAGLAGTAGTATVVRVYGPSIDANVTNLWSFTITVPGGGAGVAGTTNVARAGGTAGAAVSFNPATLNTTNLLGFGTSIANTYVAYPGTAGGGSTTYNTPVAPGNATAGQFKQNTGGGSGAGIAAAGTTFLAGRDSGQFAIPTIVTVGTLATNRVGKGGLIDGAPGEIGISDITYYYTTGYQHGSSGGGGGASASPTVYVGLGNGGAGGFPGGGGGGGGASKSLLGSGGGGNGGAGAVLLTWF